MINKEEIIGAAGLMIVLAVACLIILCMVMIGNKLELYYLERKIELLNNCKQANIIINKL